MSSTEDGHTQATKRRRVALACDMCRRRKIRCSGRQPGGGKCASCTAYGWACSFVDATKKFQRGYVEALEAKVQRYERLVHRLHPREDFTSEVGPRLTRDNWTQVEGALGGAYNDVPVVGQPASDSVKTPNGAFLSASTHRCKPYRTPEEEDDALDSFEPSDDDDDDAEAYSDADVLESLTDEFAGLSVGTSFRGKSANVRLVRAALDMHIKGEKDSLVGLGRADGEEVWSFDEWETNAIDADAKPRRYDFPDPDLLTHLFAKFFDNVHSILPFLHRPSLDRLVHSERHHADDALGRVVLLVCANGARFSDDPRVAALDGRSPAGWRWFAQARVGARSLRPASAASTSRLCDLQIACLGSMYLQACPDSQAAAWNLVGVGMRLAQHVGAHRRRMYGAKLCVEDEMYKRCFWVLVFLDRSLSASLGRACAIQEEDFDLDLPVECDDEYWPSIGSGPGDMFKQPDGKPSLVTFFVSSLKLYQILGFALRTIYSSNKAKALFGFKGADWERRTVASFDSVLNRWTDTVPTHLRWNPSCDDDTFLIQSGHLWVQYHELQIVVHRPFIFPRKKSPPSSSSSFPLSLAICANAARSCTDIMDCLQTRFPGRTFPFLYKPAFTATLVLLLAAHVWNANRSGTARHVDRTAFEFELEDIQKSMVVLERLVAQWRPAGRLWDAMNKFLATNEVPESGDVRRQMHKRRRSVSVDAEDHATMTPSNASMNMPAPPEQIPQFSGSQSSSSTKEGRAYAGGIRVRSAIEGTTSSPSAGVTLPDIVDESGQMPAHDAMWGLGALASQMTGQSPEPTAAFQTMLSPLGDSLSCAPLPRQAQTGVFVAPGTGQHAFDGRFTFGANERMSVEPYETTTAPPYPDMMDFGALFGLNDNGYPSNSSTGTVMTSGASRASSEQPFVLDSFERFLENMGDTANDYGFG